MKTAQSSGTHPVHQTVAAPLEFKINGKAMAISFTEQQLSPHAGSAAFWSWLHQAGWSKWLGSVLPHPLPLSNNRLLPLEKALAFIHGLLCEARKLTHVAYLRREGPQLEVLAVCHRRRVESSGRQNHPQVGGAGARTRLVAPVMGKDFESIAQLQCSRKSPCH
jgi:hypothetical protein